MQSSIAEQNITQNHSKDHQGRTKSLLDVLHLPFQKPNGFTNMMKQLSQSAIHYILAGCWLNSRSRFTQTPTIKQRSHDTFQG